VAVAAALWAGAWSREDASASTVTVGEAVPGDAPRAQDVVLRGREDLGEALVAAVRGATSAVSPDAVALVLDVTPYVRASEDAVVQAVLAAGGRLPSVRTWRVARLGGRMSAPLGSASAAAMEAVELLRADTAATSTMEALRTSLQGFPERGGRVVLFADWRFEDDDATESLVSALRAREQSLSVVGSEAAFSRAWNDGLDPSSPEVMRNGGDPRIGRSPFARSSRETPWHGGDGAWPAHPGYWNGQPWKSDFVPRSQPTVREDLRERLGAAAFDAAVTRPHALPSTFGPWGLTRAAGVTGGRYVLWSWNPLGRSDVTYDWAKCDLFSPDLRPRDQIRADATRRALPRAIAAAWDVVASDRVGVAGVRAPVTPEFAPQEMVRVPGGRGVGMAWSNRPQLRAYLSMAPEALRAIEEAEAELTRAIDRVPATPDAVDMRYLADAHLFRHVLRVQRFSLGEALAVARTIPDEWFRDDGSWVTLQPVTWIEDVPHASTADGDFGALADPARGRAVAADRGAMLQRYGGTPYGETVARNRVYVWRAIIVQPGSAQSKATRSPAESTPTPPAPTPGGSSGSGAAPTGR
jgi:hypothetical protein